MHAKYVQVIVANQFYCFRTICTASQRHALQAHPAAPITAIHNLRTVNAATLLKHGPQLLPSVLPWDALDHHLQQTMTL